MWEFASVMQFIFIFGKAVKIDEDFDIEVRPIHQLRACASHCTVVAEYIRIAEWLIEILQDFETELLRPDPSDKLEDIGLTLLKWISSHRSLK